MNEQYFRIGRIVRAHGVHGAVKLTPTTDDSNRFRLLSDAYLEEKDAFRPIRVFDIGVRPDAVTLRIEGVDTPEQAEKLRDVFVCVDRAHAVKLPEGAYFVADLLGCTASDTNGNTLGKVTDVMETGANDVYVIDDGKWMVPALKRVLHIVDTENGQIIFDADVLQEVGLHED